MVYAFQLKPVVRGGNADSDGDWASILRHKMRAALSQVIRCMVSAWAASGADTASAKVRNDFLKSIWKSASRIPNFKKIQAGDVTFDKADLVKGLADLFQISTSKGERRNEIPAALSRCGVEMVKVMCAAVTSIKRVSDGRFELRLYSIENLMFGVESLSREEAATVRAERARAAVTEVAGDAENSDGVSNLFVGPPPPGGDGVVLAGAREGRGSGEPLAPPAALQEGCEGGDGGGGGGDSGVDEGASSENEDGAWGEGDGGSEGSDAGEQEPVYWDDIVFAIKKERPAGPGLRHHLEALLGMARSGADYARDFRGGDLTGGDKMRADAAYLRDYVKNLKRTPEQDQNIKTVTDIEDILFKSYALSVVNSVAKSAPASLGE